MVTCQDSVRRLAEEVAGDQMRAVGPLSSQSNRDSAIMYLSGGSRMRFALLTACVCLLAATVPDGAVRRARAHQAAQEPRRQPHRHVRRRVHELLPVRLRRVAQGQPGARRQGAVGAVRPAARAEPLDAEGHPRRGVEAGDEAHAHADAGRRLLRVVHGPGRHRRGRPAAHRRRSVAHRRGHVEGGSAARPGRPAARRPQHAVHAVASART